MNEISCSITSAFIEYVKNTKPEYLERLLEGLPYDENYLLNQHNWISWYVERILENRLIDFYNDERIMYEIGRSILKLRSVGTVNIVLNLFLTPERLISYTPKLAKYFTKDIVRINVLNTSKEDATVELKIKGKQTRGACLFNQGMFSVAPELFGLEPAKISEVKCVVPFHEISPNEIKRYKLDNTTFGAESCIYNLHWKTKKIAFINKVDSKKEALEEALHNLEESHLKLRQAYELTRRSEEKYKELMENASDIICFLDYEGFITFLNKKGFELSNYSTEEIIGEHFLSFIEDSHKEEFFEGFNEGLKGGSIFSEIIFKKKNDDRLILSINSNPVYEEGRIVGLMLIARDITKEREFAARLLEAEKFAAKGLIAAEIAHEINNSLANIETALFIINKMRVEKNYRMDIIRDVYEEIDRMSGIVKGILEVYRSDSSLVQSVDINSEVTKVINMVQRRLKGKGVLIVSELSPDLPKIACYPGHIKQILLNLIKNADEAMEESKTRIVSIKTDNENGFVKLKVSDTGCGIPEEKMKNLFTPLVTSKKEGLGLGLSVCKELVERYGGEIKIATGEKNGTTFVVSFRT